MMAEEGKTSAKHNACDMPFKLSMRGLQTYSGTDDMACKLLVARVAQGCPRTSMSTTFDDCAVAPPLFAHYPESLG